MRLIGGKFRGKRLQTPSDRSIRPTSDRARESLFNIFEHQGLVREVRFLDLFCGTGAVGLEAFSRGAGEVWLMDRDLTLATANCRSLGDPANVQLHHQRALAAGPPPEPFDVVFLDPPYGEGLLEPALAQLRKGWLSKEAWIVLERPSNERFDVPAGFIMRQERAYGRAAFTFLGPG